VSAQCRVGDSSKIEADSHGCPSCPHSCVGPAVSGSPDVFVNDQKAVRAQDRGVHAGCCGTNTWVAVNGSDVVFINGRPAHRVGDDDEHCGGSGQMAGGSPNVFTGGAKTDVIMPEIDPLPHERSHTLSITDGLGRELAKATAIIRCPHNPVRTVEFSGTTTISGLCDGTTIELVHAGEEAKWHQD